MCFSRNFIFTHFLWNNDNFNFQKYGVFQFTSFTGYQIIYKRFQLNYLLKEKLWRKRNYKKIWNREHIAYHFSFLRAFLSSNIYRCIARVMAFTVRKQIEEMVWMAFFSDHVCTFFKGKCWHQRVLSMLSAWSAILIIFVFLSKLLSFVLVRRHLRVLWFCFTRFIVERTCKVTSRKVSAWNFRVRAEVSYLFPRVFPRSRANSLGW